MQSARLLLAGLPPMVARFFTDAAAARSEITSVVMLTTAHDVVAEIERAAAHIVVVSLEQAEAEDLAERLFRTSRVRVLIRPSVSGDWIDLYGADGVRRRVTALDAAELLEQALALAGRKQGLNGRP